MEILVYIDDIDLAKAQEVLKKSKEPGNDLKKLYDLFWAEMVDKYGVLRNRQVQLNIRDKYIFEWNSQQDLKRGNGMSIF